MSRSWLRPFRLFFLDENLELVSIVSPGPFDRRVSQPGLDWGLFEMHTQMGYTLPAYAKEKAIHNLDRI